MTPREDAIHLAAQCWCDEETSHKEKDSTLAMAFAKRLENLMQEREALKAQLQAKDAVIDAAVKALEAIKDYTGLHERRREKWDVQYIAATEQKITETLEQIQKMLRKNEGDEQW